MWRLPEQRRSSLCGAITGRLGLMMNESQLCMISTQNNIKFMFSCSEGRKPNLPMSWTPSVTPGIKGRGFVGLFWWWFRELWVQHCIAVIYWPTWGRTLVHVQPGNSRTQRPMPAWLMLRISWSARSPNPSQIKHEGSSWTWTLTHAALICWISRPQLWVDLQVRKQRASASRTTAGGISHSYDLKF